MLDAIINHPYVSGAWSYAAPVISDKKVQIVAIAAIAIFCFTQLKQAYTAAITIKPATPGKARVEKDVPDLDQDQKPKIVDGKPVMKKVVEDEELPFAGEFRTFSEIDKMALAKANWKTIAVAFASIVGGIYAAAR